MKKLLIGRKFYKPLISLFAAAIIVANPWFGVASQLIDQKVSAAPNGGVVVRSNQNTWSAVSASSGTTSYVSDVSAPYGNGALQLTTGSSTASYSQRSKSVSMKLSDVNELSYWTKQVTASNPTHAPSLQLTVNGLTGTSSSTNLVFEPYWNTAGNPGVSVNLPNGVWQKWNAKDGVLWSSKGYASAGLVAGGGGDPFYSLAQVIALNPNAKVTAITAKIGSYNTDHIGLVDGINLNGTVYDFEPIAPALAPQVTATNFNTNNDALYKGINVGFTLNDDFRNISSVKVELLKGSEVLVTNSDNANLLALIAGGEKSLSTPFIVTPGSYTETYWNLGQREWLRTEAPTTARITVTDEKGNHIATNNNLIEPNGWTFESLFNNYSYSPADSKFVSSPWTVRENNANDTKNFRVQVPKMATGVTFSFVGNNGAPTFSGVVGEEHIQPNQWPAPSGEHQYKVGQSLPAGEYTVTAEYKTSDGTLQTYPVTGSAAVYSVQTPIASYVSPEADGSTIIRSSDNPSQVRISDTGNHFNYVNFKIDNVTYRVNRNQCDVRQAGNYVTCEAKKSSTWPANGLVAGAHTINSVTASNTANGNVTLPARQFTVDTVVPTVVSTAIKPSGALYGKQVVVESEVEDNLSLSSVTTYAVKKVNGICNPNGAKIVTETVAASGTSQTVNTTLNTSGMNGEYCFYTSAKDTATHSSNPNSTNSKFVASFDASNPDVGLTTPTGVTNSNNAEVKGYVADDNMNYYACYITTNQAITAFNKDWAIGQEPKTGANNDESLADSSCVTKWTTANVGSSTSPTTLGNFDISGLPEGSYTIHLHAHDKAGNITEKATTFTIDRTAPVLSNLEVSENPNKSLSMSVKDDGEAVSVEFNVGGQSYNGVLNVNTRIWSAVSNLLSPGSYVVQADAKDEAFNAVSPALTQNIVIARPPAAIGGTPTSPAGNTGQGFLPITPVLTNLVVTPVYTRICSLWRSSEPRIRVYIRQQRPTG
jgi:hypothetical protein